MPCQFATEQFVHKGVEKLLIYCASRFLPNNSGIYDDAEHCAQKGAQIVASLTLSTRRHPIIPKCAVKMREQRRELVGKLAAVESASSGAQAMRVLANEVERR